MKTENLLDEVFTMNFYINKHQARLDKYPDQRQMFIEKARAHYLSLTMQRDFLETVEAFAQRKPEIEEFRQWLKTL